MARPVAAQLLAVAQLPVVLAQQQAVLPLRVVQQQVQAQLQQQVQLLRLPQPLVWWLRV